MARIFAPERSPKLSEQNVSTSLAMELSAVKFSKRRRDIHHCLLPSAAAHLSVRADRQRNRLPGHKIAEPAVVPQRAMAK
jgi:hypothetical protein